MDFFKMLVEADKTQKLTLITQKESTISSDVTEAEASKFLQVEEEGEKEMMKPKKVEADELMDEIE